MVEDGLVPSRYVKMYLDRIGVKITHHTFTEENYDVDKMDGLGLGMVGLRCCR